MAATFDDLIQEVVHNLSAFSATNDAMASLDVAVTAAETQLLVQDIGGFAQGVVQVDDELVFVQSVDTATKTLRIPAWGRGYRGTKAVAHEAGAQVTMSPTWPRITIWRAVTQTLRGLYPTIFGVKRLELASSDETIVLPEEAQRVLDVRWQDSSDSKLWHKAPAWVVDWSDEQGVLRHNLPHSFPIRVVYAVEPGVSTAPGAYFSTVTGLPESCLNLIVNGACYRLLPFLDASRAATQTVSSVEVDRTNQVGSATESAQTFLALYTQHLQQEVRRLESKYPARYDWR